MKKKITVAAAIVLCAAIAVGSTVAYYTHETTAIGRVSTDSVKIELEKWTESEDGTLVPSGDLDQVLPGLQVSKIVQVKNIGNQDAWVRVSLEEALTLADGGEGDLSLMTLDLNTQDWTEVDGYYYYLSALEPGAETEPLFTTVSFSPEMDNLYQNSTAYLDVNAEATQVIHNGDTVLDAAGWPDEG